MKPAVFLILIPFMLICCLQKVQGQIMAVDIGVNGLTCSQCTKTVEMSIRKLDFVADVRMNLEHTSGHVIFKQGRKIDLEEVANAVFSAGFSVRHLDALITFDNVGVSNGYCHLIEGQYFQFIQTGAMTLNGQVTVELQGKKYLPKNEYRKIKADLKHKCGHAGQKEFFVSVKGKDM